MEETLKYTAITHKKDNMGVVCGYGMISTNLVAYATFNNISVIWWRYLENPYIKKNRQHNGQKIPKG